jgi:spore germination cell wall hydrolase CwlJ-like protein
MHWRNRRTVLSVALILAGASLSACGVAPHSGYSNLSSRDCLARVMYFESLRSSSDGMLAVGTVVMNRRESGRYPRTVCGVVGQRNQFAEGALWKRMPSGSSRTRAYQVADAVLAGARHRGVGKAMFFHTAGRWYPYSNMHYVAVAGGNAFYERRSKHASAPPKYALRPTVVSDDVIASADRTRLATFLNTGKGLN